MCFFFQNTLAKLLKNLYIPNIFLKKIAFLVKKSAFFVFWCTFCVIIP